MIHPARLLEAAALCLVLGCGSSSFTQAAPDATSDGAGGDAGGSTSDDTGTGTPDGPSGADGSGGADAGSGHDAAGGTDGGATTDAPSDTSSGRGDSSPIDSGYFDVLAPDGACKCQPYWCGCGTCDPAQIACAVDPPPCTRGCASACPEIAQVTCTCDQGHCVRAGIDASSIGCLQDPDCPPGDCCAHHSPGSVCVPIPNTCCAGMGVPCP